MGTSLASLNYDGEEGYFFLFDLTKEKGKQCSGAISLNSASADLRVADISIKWNRSEEVVGLYVGGDLWAAFDQQGRKFTGNYSTREARDISDIVIEQFN